MLDEKDLQAIAQLLSAMEQRTDAKLEAMEQRTDAKLEAMEQRTDAKLEAMEQRIMSGAAVLLETEFRTRFNLLSEKLDIIQDRLPDPDALEKMQDELDLHHALLKQHTKEIQQLKKAQ